MKTALIIHPSMASHFKELGYTNYEIVDKLPPSEIDAEEMKHNMMVMKFEEVKEEEIKQPLWKQKQNEAWKNRNNRRR